MVLPISGFLPVPLPMMIPFMGAQSLVIGKMFGEGFQYGKRKISAMSNEEFNKLTFESMMSNAREEIKASIPSMQAAMQDMAPLVDTVVREFFNYISQVTKIVTGTGEGPNIFEQEGLEIGESIAHALGTHLPQAHQGKTGPGVAIPVGPQQPFKLPEAHRHTPEHHLPPKVTISQPIIPRPQAKRKAGPIQIKERLRLIRIIFQAGKDLKNAMTTGGNSALIRRFSTTLVQHQQALVNLLARYSF